MCASVSNIYVGENDDPNQVLSGWLDDYAAQRCDVDDLRATFISVAKSHVDAPWIALSLLDQYQRRGRIDVALVLALKADIERLVFGTSAADSPLSTPSTSTADQQGITAETIQSTDDIAEPFITDTAIHVEEHQQPREETAAPASAPLQLLRQRYELLQPIGSDTSGTVYRALDRQRDHLSRDARYVAVKIFALDATNNTASLAQIQRGFHQAQTLAHPNIRSVFDLDRDGDTCFAVMELLHGELLAKLLRQLSGRPMAQAHALNILTGIGNALTYAHEHDISHGRLSTRDVMITRSGEVMVLEFGFGSPCAKSGMFDDIETAPKPHPDDDVYALACIAYELLSGHPPFESRAYSVDSTQRRRPVRSARFTRYQWQVLRRALHWSRAKRNIGIQELLAGLGCKPSIQLTLPAEILAMRTDSSHRLRTALWVLVLLMAVALLAYVYTQVQMPLRHSEVVNQETSADTEQLAAVDPAPTISSSTSIAPVVPAIADAPSPSVDPDPLVTTTAAPPEAPSPNPKPTPDVSAALPTGAAGTTTTSAAIPRVAFAKETFVANEGDGAAKVTIRRIGSLNRAVRVRWSIVGDSNQPSRRYANLGPGVAEIPAGVRDYTLLIPLASDTVHENSELFSVHLERIEDGSVVAQPATATVIIVDDD